MVTPLCCIGAALAAVENTPVRPSPGEQAGQFQVGFMTIPALLLANWIGTKRFRFHPGIGRKSAIIVRGLSQTCVLRGLVANLAFIEAIWPGCCHDSASRNRSA